MISRATVFATRSFVVGSLVAFAFLGYGCGGDDSASLSAQFTASATPPGTVDLIKLVPQTASGGRVVIQAVIYGPDTNLDMFAFAFDVKIGDPTVLQFVTGSGAAGDALTTSAGQTIQVEAAPAMSDPSHIVVGVSKFGVGPGNGVAGASAIIVSMAFDALRQGTSTLAIATTPAPGVVDSNLAPIGSITFDSASGSVTVISTGGGGY